MKTLLVIGNDYDYKTLFEDVQHLTLKTERGKIQEEFHTVQLAWDKIRVYAENGEVFVRLSPSEQLKLKDEDEVKSVKVDYVLIREDPILVTNEEGEKRPRDRKKAVIFKNILNAFIHCNVPILNSASSWLWTLERPLKYAGLLSIMKKLGKDKFPLTPQHFYPNFREMRFTPEYPICVAVGNSGVAKMVLHKHTTFEDLSSIVALHHYYSTSEPHYDTDFIIRIQKIGEHYRAYTVSLKPGIKGEDVELTLDYKRWIDECATLFGGMDVVALDVIRTNRGKESIVNCHNSCIDFAAQHVDSDMLFLKELVVNKMTEALSIKKQRDGFLFRSDGTLNKRLELELINMENAKTEKEEQLQKANKLLSAITEKAKKSQLNMRNIAIVGVCGGLGIGIAAGIYAGHLAVGLKTSAQQQVQMVADTFMYNQMLLNMSVPPPDYWNSLPVLMGMKIEWDKILAPFL